MTAGTSSAGAASTAVDWVDGELVLARVFGAPRELVFRAWTEPEHFARWFGPHGSTLPFCTLDARPGGRLHYCHRFEGHEDVWVGGVYREVAAPERIAFTCWFSDPQRSRVERPGFPAEMSIRVTFAEEDGGTRVTARHAGLVVDQGEVQGWTESLDRLAELLATAQPPGDREIVLTREFDAPRELVFRAWTDPRHLPHWWGPDGFTNTTHEIDVREGGAWRFTMHGPDGTDYPNRIAYQEIVAPERIVYLHGDDVDDDPGRFHVTVDFADLGGRTRVTMRTLFRTAEQRAGVVAFGAVELGYQTLGRLAEHLAEM